jgi:hypothetical protein
MFMAKPRKTLKEAHYDMQITKLLAIFGAIIKLLQGFNSIAAICSIHHQACGINLLRPI